MEPSWLLVAAADVAIVGWCTYHIYLGWRKSRSLPRIFCPACQRKMRINSSGRLMIHKYRGLWCPGSGSSPEDCERAEWMQLIDGVPDETVAEWIVQLQKLRENLRKGK